MPLFNLMEDAATAEISRSQVWQWLKHGASLDDGRTITLDLLDSMIGEELERWKDMMGEEAYEHGKYAEAADIFRTMSTSAQFEEFLTLPAYDYIVENGA